ncbi:MAG: ABC transporter ATP-binding protein [Deltaproteobacteria bacterium]|nr:ABC transporter ATP-binding protein [Deltaproteobacteria bacterium]
MSDDALLKIEDLRTYFKMEGGLARAVDGVSYEIRPGRTLAVVGESGSGKSVTALSILRLIPSPPGVHAGGHIFFEGRDLTTLSESELQDIRGNKIAMIFQEPMTSLNPVFTVGDQIGESLRLHKGMTRAQAREHAIQMLKEVKIPSPEARVDEHPHQLSGGMRQRVMIAMALACNPKLLIADEPTTALDVTVQAQILDLMRELQARNGTAILFITHDLGVVAEMADDVVVMYAGKVVERADVQTLFDTPTHPYTQGLFRSMPALDGQRGPLVPIEGSVPSPLDFPSGCRFRNRCPQAVTRCAESEPALLEHGAGHVVACHVVEAKRQGVNV